MLTVLIMVVVIMLKMVALPSSQYKLILTELIACVDKPTPHNRSSLESFKRMCRICFRCIPHVRLSLKCKRFLDDF